MDLYTGIGSTLYYDIVDQDTLADVYSGQALLCQQYLAKIPAGLNILDGTGPILLFRDNGKTGMIMYNGYGRLLASKDTPFTYTISDDGDFTISYAGKTQYAKVMRAREMTDSIRIWLDPDNSENEFSQWILGKYSDDPEKIKKLRSSEESMALATAYIDASAGESSTVQMSQPGFTNVLLYDRRIADQYYPYMLESDPLTLDFTDGEGNQGNLQPPTVMPANAAYTLGQLALKVFGKDDPRVNKVIPFLLSDGRVMMIIQDNLQNEIGKYYADPVTGSITAVPQLRRCDVNCDSAVDVSDVVLLARLIVADSRARISDAGRHNADCDLDVLVTTDDVTFLLRVIAKILTF